MFYGFSGDPGPVPKWPDGTDPDPSYAIAARTVARSLRTLYPDDHILVVQTWKKEILLETLQKATLPVREVHVCCHGDASRLSLAKDYDGGAWVYRAARIMDGLSKRTFNGVKVFDDVGLGRAAIASELAICAGLFSSAMSAWDVFKLRHKHRWGAAWMIWGCYAGGASTTHGSSYDASDSRKSYFQRMNLGAASVDGIAKEIAKHLGVTCTAATGHGGTDFWHRKGGVILPNKKHAPNVEPYWMWGVAKSHWVTYDKDGTLLPAPILYGKARSVAELTTPDQRPPAWLVDLYDGKIR
ncbi:MAG: hypothetical protein KF773_29340 [Deltaproteobacteria bacterium]|nr:hypothetical protein [Deltaproteobacteria bacterium]MCW5802858.1 hypothetical protein [Deltaproteobacteria bacterium]